MNHRDVPPLPDASLRDRAVLVTGASGGLGRAVALGVARAGATVVLHGREERKLVTLYDEIVALGAPEPAAIPLDFAGAGSRHFDVLAADIGENVGRLDGIVHCASRIERLALAHAVAAEDWAGLFQVNVAAALGLTRACLPLLKAAPDASVVFTLEAHHAQADAYWGVASVPGVALATAMRTLASETASHPGVRFNAVVPGPIDTPSRRITHPGEARASLPAPASVVPAYVWLLGPASRESNGQVVAPGG